MKSNEIQMIYLLALNSKCKVWAVISVAIFSNFIVRKPFIKIVICQLRFFFSFFQCNVVKVSFCFDINIVCSLFQFFKHIVTRGEKVEGGILELCFDRVCHPRSETSTHI